MKRLRVLRSLSAAACLVLAPAIASAQEPAPELVPNQYIVVLKDSPAAPPQVAAQMAQAHGLGVGHVYSAALRGFSAFVPPGRLRVLQNDPRVLYVEQDQVMRASGALTGVDRVDADRSPTASIDGNPGTEIGNDGNRLNVDIAVIDTGIQTGLPVGRPDFDHPDLNVVGGRNFTNTDPNNYQDGNGHGTHVAGTIAAKDDNFGVVGVAPGARLWAVRVLSDDGSGQTSWVIAGVEWVTKNANVFEVANMSLGGGNSPTLNNAISKSVKAGVTYTVAAGNSSRDAKLSSPANCSDVLCVSAIADYDGIPGGFAQATTPYGKDDTFASFSNFGSVVDIAAPGVDILSTFPTYRGDGSGYARLSGTSMASPHVAGAASLYIAKQMQSSGGTRPTPAAVRSALLSTDNAVPQNKPYDGQLGGFTGDRDNYPEPLVNVRNF